MNNQVSPLKPGVWVRVTSETHNPVIYQIMRQSIFPGRLEIDSPNEHGGHYYESELKELSQDDLQEIKYYYIDYRWVAKKPEKLSAKDKSQLKYEIPLTGQLMKWKEYDGKNKTIAWDWGASTMAQGEQSLLLQTK